VQFRRIGDDHRSLHPVAICTSSGHGRSSSAKPAMSRLANPSPLASRSSKATAREIGPSPENRLDFSARGQIQPIGARGINPFSAHIFPILPLAKRTGKARTAGDRGGAH
jgi:hypothetical protein